MKKILTIMSLAAILISISFNASEAAQKRVLSEQVTNASSASCAIYNPQYAAYAWQNYDKMVPLAYHGWWPGSGDPMWNANQTTNYYRILTLFTSTEIYVPWTCVDGNKYRGNDINQVKGAVASQANKTTPLTISVENENDGLDNFVTVTVSSTADLSGKKLHIAVAEAFHYYANAGNNGEKNFFFIARTMLPDHEGTDFSIKAGEEKTYTQSFRTNINWYPHMLYVAAWVQDPNTNEVHQAASTPIPDLNGVESKPRQGIAMSAAKQHGKIPNGGSDTREIILTNPMNEEVTCKIDLSQSSFPNGWTYELDKEEVTIPANGTAAVNATLTAGPNDGMAILILNVIPDKKENIVSLITSYYLSALSENTENVFFTGTNGMNAFIYNSFQQENGNPEKTSLIPYTTDFLSAYPLEDFKTAIFTFDQPNRGVFSIGDASTAAINGIKQMLAAGKNVLITGELELYNALLSGSGAGFDFFTNVLKIDTSKAPELRVTVNQDGQITEVNPYPLMGIVNDPIGDGVNITMNQYLQNHQAYNIFTDIIRIKQGSKSRPFIYSDNVKSDVLGIRYEDSGGKLVFMTCGFEGISDELKRNDLMARILNWFEGGATGPEISLTKESLDFGTVDIGKTKTLNFTIQNTGVKDLNISKLEVEYSYSHMFEITPKAPQAIPPGGGIMVNVKFKPVDETQRTVKLTIESNADNAEKKTVDLMCKGLDVSSVKDGISTNGLLTISASPNPVQDMTTINYNITGSISRHVELILLNPDGSEAGKIINKTVSPGEHNLRFNSSAYSSGIYFLILKSGESSVELPLVIVK